MITIIGRIPSKKNSSIAFAKGGRVFHFASNAYRTWHKNASKQLKGIKPIETPCRLQIDFYFPDKRKTDLSNKTESIMDLLVDNGIIPDDNCIEIPELLLIYKGVDKVSPRAEITWQAINTNQL